MITLKEQVILIVYFLLFGMFLAILYDILHYYLNKYKVNIILGYFIQTLFWLGLVYLACSYMLKVSQGYLTIYTFGFFLLGALIHINFFSKGFSEDIARVDSWLVKMFIRLKKIIIIIIFPKEVFYVIWKITPKKRHFIKLGNFIIRIYRKYKYRTKIKIKMYIIKRKNRARNRRSKREKDNSNNVIVNRTNYIQ